MKKTRLFLFISMTSVIFSTSCKKNSTITNANSSTTSNDMTATIEGSAWACTTALGAYAGGPLVISGTTTDGQAIVLNIGAYKTGVYSLDSGSVSSATYSPKNLSNYTLYTTGLSSKAMGSINLISLDTSNQLATGTFNFTGVNAFDKTTKNITNGTFTNLPFINKTRYEFSATVNGQSFSPKIPASEIGEFTYQGQISIDVNCSPNLMQIILPQNVKTGTYNIGSSGNFQASYSPAALIYKSTSGTITITQRSPTVIMGTFQYIAVNTQNSSDIVTVKGGSFVSQIN